MRKIYISRKKTSKLNILNEDNVWSFLDMFGFQKIIAEEKSISEIAQIFYKASHIVGPHGSGFTNIIFCQKNTRVVEYYSKHITNDYRNIYHQLGFKYYVFQGMNKNKEKPSLNSIKNKRRRQINIEPMYIPIGELHEPFDRFLL